MTPEDYDALKVRMTKAGQVRTRLRETEAFLLAVQGTSAVEQHELVAERLQKHVARPRLSGLAVIKGNSDWNRLSYDDLVLTPEMQEHLCAVARLLVQQYREELAKL